MLKTIFGFVARLIFIVLLVGVFAGAIVYGVRYIQDNSSDDTEIATNDDGKEESSSKSDSKNENKSASSSDKQGPDNSDSTDGNAGEAQDLSATSQAPQTANGELPQAGSSSLISSVAVVVAAGSYLSYHKLRDTRFDNQQINR